MPIDLGALNQAHHGGSTLTGAQRPCKKPIVTPQGNLAVILPMSGRSWKFSIAGMRSMVVGFDASTASTELPVRWFTSRWSPA